MNDCPTESALLEYVAGNSAEQASLEAHLVGCERCRAAVVALVSRTVSTLRQSGVLVRGASVGRYVVIDLIGQGAMGQVHAAYDPVLDRKVALKLLHPMVEGVEARERLLLEAKALAKVAHPNLVGVYDAGPFQDSVFIAMEFVDGQTLRSWLKAQKRTSEEIVDAFLQAGQGLSAAHAAGLVHRDFKPENVLVGRDGRVRVSDFGLARQVSDLPSAPASTDAPVGVRTVTGALVGTPAYMAPEQLAGQPAGPRADQFAFAVAFYEALAGERPFSRNAQEVVRAGFRALPSVQLQRAVARALAVEPESRFASMDELLAAIGPSPVRRWPLLVAAAALLIGLGVFLEQRREAPCSSGAAKVGAVVSDGRQAELARQFKALGGEAVFETISRALGDYRGAWATMHREACEATRVRGEQSDQVLTVRMACLDRRLVEIEGVLGVLATTDATTLPRVSDSLNALTPLSVCSNVDALLAPVSRPEQPKVLERVTTVERELARAQALNEAGRFKEGVPLARSTALEAHDIGWAPLEAEALLALGTLTQGAGQTADAEPMLRDAFARATEAKADRLAVIAAVSLSFLYNELGRLKEAQEWGWLAAAVLKRVGDDFDLESRVANQEGHLLGTQGDFRGAEVRYRRAWELRKRNQGDLHPRTILMWANVGASVGGQGHAEKAVTILRAVASQLEQTLGRTHYKVGQAHYGVAEQLMALHRAKDALEEVDAILPLQLGALGPENPHVGRLEMVRGNALIELKRFDEAVAAEQRALDCFRSSKVALMEAVATRSMGRAHCGAKRLADAELAFRTARTQFEALFGENHDEILTTNEAEGECLLDLGEAARALSLFERTTALREKANGPEDPWNAFALSGLGRAQLAVGKKDLARATLSRAVALLESSKLDEQALEETKAALTQAR